MSILQNKIDFAVIISATDANPNGDPLNGNRPRENSEGFGEISDVCIKRKIRNRLQDMGEYIFVQSDDRCDDGCDSLHARVKKCEELKGVTNRDEFVRIACKKWIDVRAFGQVFAFKGTDVVSASARGPVSIGIAKSISPIDIISMKIVKSVNNEDGEKKGPDTMGIKNRVEFGLYVFKGSINCQLAEKTGFTEEDAEKIKEALKTLFENDCSSARPEGSMQVCRVYWWKHDSKTPAVSSAKVHNSLKITEKSGLDHRAHSFEDYDIVLEKIDGLAEPEIFGDM